MIRKFISFSLVVTLVWSTWPVGVVVAQNTSPDQNEIGLEIERLSSYIETTKALRSLIDRSQFDLDALIDRLDWDPELIIKFVRDEVEFEQYPGLLRGPQGALFSRSGNSLDQAVLLAKLLKDIGLDSRVARTTLSKEQVGLLLSQMPHRKASYPAPVNVQSWLELARRTGDEDLVHALDQVPLLSSEIDLAIETSELLEKALSAYNESGAEWNDDVFQEARDYFWVEYSNGGAADWVSVQPVFPAENDSFSDLEAKEYLEDEVPQSLQHRVRLAVFVERAEIGTLKTHQVIPDWERPAANIAGRGLWIMNYPDGFEEQELFRLDLMEAIDASELFTPLFNGSVLDGTKGFDLDGVPYDLDAKGMDTIGATPIFRTVGEKADQAVAALQSIGKEESQDRARYLTAQWVEYTLISPSGESETFRRYLFDRIGPAARNDGDLSDFDPKRAAPWQPFAAEEWTVTTGRQPPALALDEMLNDKIAKAQLRREFLETGKLNEETYGALTTKSRGAGASTLFALLQGLDADLREHTVASTYRSAPSFVSLHWHFPNENRLTLSTDMIGNEHRSRKWDNAGTARADIRLRGVWETVAEGRVWKILGVSGQRAKTPFAAIHDHEQDEKRIIVASSRESLDLPNYDLPVDQRQLMTEQIDRGYSVAFFSGQPSHQASWWRIDPRNGSAIGFLPNGRAATGTEYIIGLTLIAASIIGPIAYYGITLHDVLRCGWKYTQEQLRPFEPKTLADEEKPTISQCLTSDE